MDLIAPIESNTTFVPYPKITFLVDQPRNLVCQICQESKLRFQTGRPGVDEDTIPAIMPCGHIVGLECLKQWLGSHDNCPMCRYSLRYKYCKHQITMRAVTKAGIHLLPKTLPDGGFIPDQCIKCRNRTKRAVSEQIFESVKDDFLAAREKFTASRSPRDEKEMVKQKRLLEEVMMRTYFNESYVEEQAKW